MPRRSAASGSPRGQRLFFYGRGRGGGKNVFSGCLLSGLLRRKPVLPSAFSHERVPSQSVLRAHETGASSNTKGTQDSGPPRKAAAAPWPEVQDFVMNQRQLGSREQHVSACHGMSVSCA